MYGVEDDEIAAGGQRPRFSPLKMVARALGAWQAEPEAAPAISPPPPPVMASPAAPPLPMFEERSVAPTTEASGENFLSIVNAMLALDDEMALEPDDAEFDLVALLDEAHATFAAEAEGRAVTLALAVGPGASGLYQGDFLRLRQTVLNLLSGALKATTEDMVELTATWDADVLTLDLAGAEVAAVMSRILAAGSRTSARRGAAQRLALARTSALALGGRVRLAPLGGVEVTIPLRRVAKIQVAAPQPEPMVEAAPPTPVFAPGLRVLVAEGSPAHQQVLTTLLAGMDVEAVVARDAEEVVTAWREERWDVVLIDIESAAICGRSIASSIRAAEGIARWSRMPMLAVAANLQLRDLDEEFAGMVDGLVAKPIHAAGLYTAIARALGEDEAAPAGAIQAA